MRILIVEDDTLFASTLGRNLKTTEPDYEVFVANSIKDARKIIYSAKPAIDVILVDRDMRPGDGMQLLQDLRRDHRDLDAIVITGRADLETGLAASSLGAHYFEKPLGINELVVTLREVRHHRSTQHERDWLKVLAEVAEEVQRKQTVNQVADTVVRYARRLGFERARLWLVGDDGKTLTGLSQIGNAGMDDFRGRRFAFEELPYSGKALESGHPEVFAGRDLGQSAMETLYADRGWRAPVGQWAELPLLGAGRRIGVLALDNAEHARPLTDQLVDLLGLFANHAAVALERSLLHEREIRQAQEWQILSDIGKRIGRAAASEPVEKLLDAVRDEMSQLINVDNFMVVLLQEETEHLDFRRKYERGELQGRYWRARVAGLVGHVLNSGEPLLLTDCRVAAYCEEHRIKAYGPEAASWLGVPLRVGDRRVGLVVVQSEDNPRAYTESDKQLLCRVADQVAGAIETARLAELERLGGQQLATLQKFSPELLGLAQEDEDCFWHAVLTAITTRDGLSLNRAVLFLPDESGTQLTGRMGIGFFRGKQGRESWETDEAHGLTPDVYLGQLRRGDVRRTPVEKVAPTLGYALGDPQCAFDEAIKTRTRVLVDEEEVKQRLPADFVKRFGCHQYAVAPLVYGKKVPGLVIVDNAIDNEPLHPRALDRLDAFLAQAALIYEQQRHQHAVEVMLTTSRGEQPVVPDGLREALTKICQAAAALTRADAVVIYPLRSDTVGLSHDGPNVAHVGLRSPQEVHNDRLRHKGVSGHVLTNGPLVIPDVSKAPHRFREGMLAQHKFLVREAIEAFIGVPILARGDLAPLGVLFLNYRTTRAFNERDRHLADLLSALAADTIARHREAKGVAQAMREGALGEHELAILQRVLQMALSAAPVAEHVMTHLLHAGGELLNRQDTRLVLAERHWQTAAEDDHEPHEVRLEWRIDETGQLAQTIESDVHSGTRGQALARGEPVITPSIRRKARSARAWVTLSEMDAPFRIGNEVGGVLSVESTQPDAFTPADLNRLVRLAAVAALALDNTRRHEHLRLVLEAARAVTAPSELSDTLDAVVRSARRAAPGLSCATLWYRHPETDKVMPGPQWGVRESLNKHQRPAGRNSSITRLMRSRDPVWAVSSMDDPALEGVFVTTEDIVSTAAFPLWAANESVGALYLNYRVRHIFTPEEEALFPIFAEIAAASIRDGQLLKEAQSNERRLEFALQVANKVGNELDLNEVLRSIIRYLGEVFPGNIAYVQLYDEAARVLVFAPASLEVYSIDNELLQGQTRIRLDWDKSITVRVAKQSLENGSPARANVGRVRDDPDYTEHHRSTESELCVGLMSGPRLLGTLVVESPIPDAFGEEDEKLIGLIGHQVALAIDRAEQAKRNRRTDAIAGIGAWASELAHEFNREIGFIRNRVYWLEMEEDLSPGGVTYAREIDGGAAKLAEKVRDAFTVREATDALFVPDEILRERVEAWVHERAPNVELILVAGAGDAMVLGRKEQFWIALRHLIRNALQAMHRAGRLWVESRCMSEGRIEIRVEDEGPGVPPEFHDILMREPFSSRAGSGLGLMLASYFIEQMQGNLSLSPYRPGYGAEFLIRLPVARNDQEANHDEAH